MKIDERSGDYILENGSIWTEYAYKDFKKTFDITPEEFYRMDDNSIKNSDMTYIATKNGLDVEWETLPQISKRT